MSRSIRIAQVCPKYFPSIGGIETHVTELSERLVKRGYDVQVLTTNHTGKLPDEETINNVKVKRFKTWAPHESYWFSNSLKTFLQKHSNMFDVVHAHSYHAFPALYAAKAKNNNYFVLTAHYHGTGHSFLRKILHVPYKAVGAIEFKKADKIICVSEYERNLILKNFNVDINKTVLIPNGVDVELFNKISKDKKRKDKKGTKVILYVGRLEKYKGVQYVIQSLCYLEPNVIFQVVGKGPYKETLIKIVENLQLCNRVFFFEGLSKDELVQKYANADVFVLLSENEAFGISVCEALASRVPCIVAETSALTEWIDNKNCFGIKAFNDPLAVAALIKQVISNEVRDLHLTDWDHVIEKTAELYDELST